MGQEVAIRRLDLSASDLRAASVRAGSVRAVRSILFVVAEIVRRHDSNF